MNNNESVRVRVKVTANAHKAGLVGYQAGIWQIKVNASPIDGKANDELCEMLAGILDINKSAISIRSGHSARVKTLLVSGVDEDRIFAILNQRLDRISNPV